MMDMPIRHGIYLEMSCIFMIESNDPFAKSLNRFPRARGGTCEPCP